MRHLRRIFANRVQFFEASSDLRASAAVHSTRSINLSNFRPQRPLRPLQKMENPLLDRLPFVISRMRHQILRSNRNRPDQFPAKRLDRLLAYPFVRRRQVDQIVIVNHQRRQVVLLPNAFSSSMAGALGTDAFHCRGLDEKICNVFAPISPP